MQTVEKYMPQKTMYVSKETQDDIDRLKVLLIADGVDLTDHTGAVRDGVLFRILVEQELKRRTTEKGASHE